MSEVPILDLNNIGMNLLDNSHLYVSSIKFTTGITSLDAILGGGIPYSKIVEIAGAESQGKSSFALHCTKRVLDSGGYVKYVDCENSWEADRVAAFGIPITISPVIPYAQEDAFDAIIDTAKKVRDAFMKFLTDNRPKGPGGHPRAHTPGEFKILVDKWPLTLIIFDTFTSKPLRSELEGERWKGGMAERPIINKMFLRHINTLISGVPIIVLLLNQVMSTIGKWSSGMDSPGGQGLKHFCHGRLFVHATEKIAGESGSGVGMWVRFHAIKSKLAPPWSKAFAYLDIQKGFKDSLSIFDFLDKAGIVKTKGGWKSITGVDGKDKSFRFDSWEEMCNDPLFYEYVKLLVFEKVGNEYPITLGKLYTDKINRLNEIRITNGQDPRPLPNTIGVIENLSKPDDIDIEPLRENVID